MKDEQRSTSICLALARAHLDVLVCALPMNVLLLSGYWPVVGTGAAVAFADGAVDLLIPADELDLARRSAAREIQTFSPGSLEKIATASEAIREPLGRLIKQRANHPVRIGFEHGAVSEPASYAAMHLYQGAIEDVLKSACPSSVPVPADELLNQLRAVKTGDELAAIRTACELAKRAFEAGSAKLRAGLTELQAAELVHAGFSTGLENFADVQRAGGFVYAMSGANSAEAHGAFAQSRPRLIEDGDLVLVHCNSYADGRWTDITRTYLIGEADERQLEMYTAVFSARDAALREIAPGRRAADVDRAARSVLEERGFGPNFKHSTGHGVGFGAISANALPRLHPKSPDLLTPGMVFNVEPAVYMDGYGGIRHCDMVAVTESGVELLTPFQTRVEELVLTAVRDRA